MVLRAEDKIAISNKTVLKIMHELGIRCGIRRMSAYRRYNSYRGLIGSTYPDAVRRNFSTEKAWQKIGTDVTEFKCAWGKAYLAPAYDFASKEIVAWSISQSPDMKQQHEMLDILFSKKPKGSRPIMHSDQGWQYQTRSYQKRLSRAGCIQSMSRKGNCLDNAATEQLFGHIKDEFFRGQKFKSFEEFKRELNDYIIYWNTKRRQEGLRGLTPQEFGSGVLAV